MVKVQILTTPTCSSCATVEGMLDKMGVEYEIFDVTQHPDMLQKYPIMTAPGIVIDGVLEFSGVPKVEKLAEKVKS